MGCYVDNNATPEYQRSEGSDCLEDRDACLYLYSSKLGLIGFSRMPAPLEP